MVLSVCKCLNVTLESDKIEDIAEIGKLDLASVEQRDIFFSEKLASCSASSLKCLVVQPALLSERKIGRCALHSCLACGHTTHTVIHDKNGLNLVLIPKSLQTTQDRINTLKKSSHFSPVFNLLVPEVSNDIEMKENMDTNNLIMNENRNNPPVFQVMSTLSKQMNQTLQSQLEAVQEAVRQFTDQKYAEFEAYKERAKRDHKILASIVSKARSMDNSWNESNEQNGPPSPYLPPQERRRLSSIKDAKKLHSFVKMSRRVPTDDDSLDAEDVFDLEGMDSQNHNMGSDLEDFDDDDDSDRSNDEGIHISRTRGADIAHSAPMNMPAFPNSRVTRTERDDDDYEEPQDIAASIKALARSVHGDTFEVPRPRFSTQI